MATDQSMTTPNLSQAPFITGPPTSGDDGRTGKTALTGPRREPDPSRDEDWTGKNSRADRRQTTIDSSDARLDPCKSATSMLKKPLPNVLPLHLAPIDQFFCDDDTARYPMTSTIHLDFTGQLQRAEFEMALDEALERHVLLRSIIKPAKRNLPCWVKAPDRLPWTDWGPKDKPLILPGSEQIDITKSSGLRFWIRGDEESTRVTLQVHHACTDGTGVYRFLGDLLAAYAVRMSDQPGADVDFAEIDPLLLRTRRRKMADRGHHNFSVVRFILHSLKQAYHVFGKSIPALQAPNGKKPATVRHEEFPGVHTVGIDKAQHKKLRSVAGSYGGTMNDLLMAEMFRTIVRWNEKYGATGENRWLRIMMPFDLREQVDYNMPAANMTSYTFVTRRLSECADIKQLMASVRDETLALKHQRAGTQFIDAIMAAAYAPFMLKYLLRRERCIATTCLSNIGDPSKRFTADFKGTKVGLSPAT